MIWTCGTGLIWTGWTGLIWTGWTGMIWTTRIVIVSSYSSSNILGSIKDVRAKIF